MGSNRQVFSESLSKASGEQIKRQKVKTELTDEQDKLILTLYKTYGGNWKKISAFFYGISPNLIKNRYYTVLKPKVEEEGKANNDLKEKNAFNNSGVNEDSERKAQGSDAGKDPENASENGKAADTQMAVKVGAGIRAVSLDGLSEVEKKKRLLGLYQKAMEIENYIKKTKSQIHNLVTKGMDK